MMEVARTSETSVDIQLRTRQYIPEYSELHTRRRENLKSTVISSQVLFHDGSLLHSKFNTPQLITVHNSSIVLTQV
jgi:hypothetical protein